MIPQTRTAAITLEVSAYAHGRVPRALRRRQILAVADQLFGERGYQRASMDELARRVGVSKPVIYELVGSKEQVFHEVMCSSAEELAERVSRAVAAEQDPSRKLRAGSLAFFGFVDERRAEWAAMLAVDSALLTEELTAARRLHSRMVAEMLADGARDAGVTPDPQREEILAHAINGAYEALAAWWQDHPEVSAETLADLLTGLLAPGLEWLSAAARQGASALTEISGEESGEESGEIARPAGR